MEKFSSIAYCGSSLVGSTDSLYALFMSAMLLLACITTQKQELGMCGLLRGTQNCVECLGAKVLQQMEVAQLNILSTFYPHSSGGFTQSSSIGWLLKC